MKQYRYQSPYSGQYIENPSGPDKPDKQDGQNDDQGVGSEKQTDQIIETGSVITGDGKHTIHCLTIIGQIEGHYLASPQSKTTKYEHVIPQLVAIEEEPRIAGV